MIIIIRREKKREGLSGPIKHHHEVPNVHPSTGSTTGFRDKGSQRVLGVACRLSKYRNCPIHSYLSSRPGPSAGGVASEPKSLYRVQVSGGGQLATLWSQVHRTEWCFHNLTT